MLSPWCLNISVHVVATEQQTTLFGLTTWSRCCGRCRECPALVSVLDNSPGPAVPLVCSYFSLSGRNNHRLGWGNAADKLLFHKASTSMLPLDYLFNFKKQECWHWTVSLIGHCKYVGTETVSLIAHSKYVGIRTVSLIAHCKYVGIWTVSLIAHSKYVGIWTVSLIAHCKYVGIWTVSWIAHCKYVGIWTVSLIELCKYVGTWTVSLIAHSKYVGTWTVSLIAHCEFVCTGSAQFKCSLCLSTQNTQLTKSPGD